MNKPKVTFLVASIICISIQILDKIKDQLAEMSGVELTDRMIITIQWICILKSFSQSI